MQMTPCGDANSLVAGSQLDVLFLNGLGCGESKGYPDIESWIKDFEASSNDSNSTEAPTEMENMGFVFGAAVCCGLLGVCSVLLNTYVLFTLVFHKRVLKNVFFMLVLHCSLVDCMRGLCLIIWCIPYLHLPIASDGFLILTKINQYVLLLLRAGNLLTISNLLIFTINEYIVIKHPLHYRRMFRRRVVFMVLVCTWIVSIAFAIGVVVAKKIDSGSINPLVSNEISEETLKFFQNLTRHSKDTPLSFHTIFTVAIFALCYACLITVFFCYGVVLAAIRKYHHRCNDGDLLRERESLRIKTESSQRFLAQDKRCRSHRRWQMHLMSRHKYVLVIGSVLLVDVLFLIPYSGIQIISYLHLIKGFENPSDPLNSRWVLQIIIGVHAVCQPLCYFRMAEFSRLACFCFASGGGRRGSKQPGPTSTWRRSFHSNLLRERGSVTVINGTLTPEMSRNEPMADRHKLKVTVARNYSQPRMHKWSEKEEEYEAENISTTKRESIF